LCRSDNSITAHHACLHDVTVGNLDYERNDPTMWKIYPRNLVAWLRQRLSLPQLDRFEMTVQRREIVGGQPCQKLIVEGRGHGGDATVIRSPEQ
jgi:hypothetical protein